jgi:membrane protein DedA with SNARE-associated domain
MKRSWRRLLPPVAIIGVMIILECAARVGLIPAPAALLEYVTRYLRTASPYAIGLISFFENIVGVTTYFPGSVVILVAMASTRGDLGRALLTFAGIVGGAALAHHVDFLIGRFLGRSEDVHGLRRSDILAALAAYWHPQLGSVFSTQRGAAGLRYKAFVALLATVWFSWNIFWGILMYTVGNLPVSNEQWEFIFAVYVIGWLLLECWRLYRSGAPQTPARPK